MNKAQSLKMGKYQKQTGLFFRTAGRIYHMMILLQRDVNMPTKHIYMQ